MEHKHSELIKRWADDTSMVILYKNVALKWLEATEQESPHWFSGVKYFLVCKKHVEVALHWLNGGTVECDFNNNSSWVRNDDPEFGNHFEYRKKPKLEKVKVWIGVGDNSLLVMKHPEITGGFLNMTWTEVEANKLIQ